MRIYPIHMGVCTSYLVVDSGAVLVDAGGQGHGRALRRAFDRAGLTPRDLRLVFLTHGHWDHIAFLAELRELSDAPVAINRRERAWVERGDRALPAPMNLVGRVLELAVRSFALPRQTWGGVPVDIPLGDERVSLDEYGVRGTLIHTPGHSAGSMSLLLHSGEAFVGDLAVNGLPQRLGPNMSVFADDPERVISSWRTLLAAGAKVIYPAHGKPFPAEALRQLLPTGGAGPRAADARAGASGRRASRRRSQAG